MNILFNWILAMLVDVFILVTLIALLLIIMAPVIITIGTLWDVVRDIFKNIF